MIGARAYQKRDATRAQNAQKFLLANGGKQADDAVGGIICHGKIENACYGEKCAVRACRLGSMANAALGKIKAEGAKAAFCHARGIIPFAAPGIHHGAAGDVLL
jgi:hypothetical protein